MLRSERIELNTSTELSILTPASQAGGVDQDKVFAVAGVRNIDRVTGGAGDVRNNGAIVVKDRVDQGRFADIGPADDGDRTGLGRRLNPVGWISGESQFAKHVFNLLLQIVEIPSVFGTDGD